MRERSVAAVQAVYVEVASDIYVSERLLAAPPAQDSCVKVVLPAGRGQDVTTMARVPAKRVLAAGDTVTVKRPTRVLDLISTARRRRPARLPCPPPSSAC